MSKPPRRFPSQQITIVIVDSPREAPDRLSAQEPSSKRWSTVFMIVKIISGAIGLAAAVATVLAVVH